MSDMNTVYLHIPSACCLAEKSFCRIGTQLFDNWIGWISFFKVSYVIMKLHNSSHLLKACLNNANRRKPIIIIIIIIAIEKEGIRTFRTMFEQNRGTKLYFTTLYVTIKILV